MTALWTPSPTQIEQANMTRFRAYVNDRFTLSLNDDKALHTWSIDSIGDFWSAVWDFCKIKGTQGKCAVIDADKMPGCQFFPDAQLNYAENLLNAGHKDNSIALHFWGEDKVKRQISFLELKNQVSLVRQFLDTHDVKTGARVAAFMPNMPETTIAMLAATSLGAVWSSASPDFGVQGVIDRFGQIEPEILICVDGYYYNGKWVDCRDKLKEIIPQLPSLKAVLFVSYHPDREIEPLDDRVVLWSALKTLYEPKEIDYVRVAFNHPLFIMFSSGTTGKPKCIVHGTGGTLLQHVKELALQSDVHASDRVFYFTTCGWMMWNWQMSALALGAALCLYDGSPFAHDPLILFDYADEAGFTLFGTGAKYIDSLKKQNLSPKEKHDLTTVRTLTSTGSPLVPEGFDYVYDHIKQNIHLQSVCGGTDIISCFMIGYPTLPVYRGELQGAGLGYALNVYTAGGKPCPVGEKGELVCTKPFVSMPVGFWLDKNDEKYRNAYFNRFDNIWHHGDFVEKTEHDGYIVYGRSDATLNPGGVRIGTAEIYAQVEKLPEIIESIVVGQKWDDDERVILFVILDKNQTLTDDLTAIIRKTIRDGASPRHVPAKVIAVTDIPRTKNNKISEIAVRDTINGLQVANTEALANPESLNLYLDLQELKQT